jgi:prophage regulatory protein
MTESTTWRVLRAAEMCARLGISRVTLWRWERAGLIPRKRKLGPNTIGWLEPEVEAWLASRPTVPPQGRPLGEPT